MKYPDRCAMKTERYKPQKLGGRKMRAKGLILGLVTVSVLSFAAFAVAGVPRMINYQGVLTDSAGCPKDDSFNMVFRIYADSSGGSHLWEQNLDQVSVTKGNFNVVLVIPDSLFEGSTELWLAIRVGNDAEMTPRQRIASVGYAFQSQYSDTADYARAGGAPDNDWIYRVTDGGDTTLTTGGEWGIARYGNELFGNADYTHVNFGTSCTTGTSGENYLYCTVGGGYYNTASGERATVAGGSNNTATGSVTTVAGGSSNAASEDLATVGGGYQNTASAAGATIVGGYHNTSSGLQATVGGGHNNSATGDAATVPGGGENVASGHYSFAAGHGANADHIGAFVWADNTPQDFASTSDNQFLIRASGGVGIGTNDPDAMLDVRTEGGTALMGRSEGGTGVEYGGRFYGLQDGTDNIGLVAFGGCDALPCTPGSHSNIGIWAITSNGSIPSIPSGDWAGYFDGDVRVDADLDVSGSTTIDDDLSVGGTISLTFDYESVWTAIAADDYEDFTHNLGGDPSKYIVFLYGKSTSGYIHQKNYGTNYIVGGWRGCEWGRLTSTSIRVWRGDNDDSMADDADWKYVKVRILKNQ